MAKFYGGIGYIIPVEISPGVWVDTPTEKKYSGDVLKTSTSWKNGENLNDNLIINNSISIVSDLFSNQNFGAIRYVHWLGAYFEVTNVTVMHPRLVLTMGGVYNGIKAIVPQYPT